MSYCDIIFSTNGERKIQAVVRKALSQIFMTQNQIKIQFLIKGYRYKHKDEPEKIKQLERILWKSIPIVYPNYFWEMGEIERAIQNRKLTKWRTNKFLTEMAECYDHLYFVTLTFTDEVMKSTTERTRHRYVTQFLKSEVRCYYANIDYGEKNEREHYHAVVSDKVDFSKWTHGSINAEQIRNTKKDRRKISTYMRKLTNHAHKMGTGKAFHSRGMLDVDTLPF